MPKIARFTASAGPAPAVASERTFADTRGQSVFGQALEQVGDIAIRIADADMRQKQHASAVGLASDLSSKQFELESDPDYETHVERFKEYQKQALAKYRAPLFGRYAQDFDIDAQEIIARTSTQVAHSARAKAIDIGNARVDETLRVLLSEAGRSADPGMIEFFKAAAVKTVSDAVESGLMKHEKGINKIQGFNADLEMASVRRDSLADVEGTLLKLRTGGYDLSAERRQILIEEMQREADTRLRRIEAQRKRDDLEDDRRAKREGSAAFVRILKKAADLDGPGATLEDFEQEAELLSDARDGGNMYEEAFNIVQNGGRLFDHITDPEVYNDLDQRVRNGEDITSATTAAYASGALNPSDRDDLVERSTIFKRYKDQFDALFFAPEFYSGMDPKARDQFKYRLMQAKRSFTRMLRQIPDMSQEDAWDLVDSHVRSVASEDPTSSPSSMLLPDRDYTIFKDEMKNIVDIEATANELAKAFYDKRISEIVFVESMQRLVAIDKAQTIRTQAMERAKARLKSLGQ